MEVFTFFLSFFLIFLSLVVLLNFYFVKNGEKIHQKFLEEINLNEYQKIKNIKGESWLTYGFGGRFGKKYMFNFCDIYLNDDTVIILGRIRNILFETKTYPNIVTDKVDFYKEKFPYTNVRKLKLIKELNDNSLYIQIGEVKLNDFVLDISLYNLNVNKEKIENVLKTN